jgi:hypothetical protein
MRMERFTLGLYEPGCVDLDSRAILQGFFRQALQSGAEIMIGAEARRIARHSGTCFVNTGSEILEAGSSMPLARGPIGLPSAQVFRAAGSNAYAVLRSHSIRRQFDLQQQPGAGKPLAVGR